MSRRFALIAAFGLALLGPASADSPDYPYGFFSAATTGNGRYLGHFSGGRTFPLADPRKPYAVAWRDQYARFESQRECRAWLADMTRASRQLEGWKTCIPLR